MLFGHEMVKRCLERQFARERERWQGRTARCARTLTRSREAGVSAAYVWARLAMAPVHERSAWKHSPTRPHIRHSTRCGVRSLMAVVAVRAFRAATPAVRVEVLTLAATPEETRLAIPARLHSVG